MTDINIRTAVSLWFSDRAAAIRTYGYISTWETGGVTDMSYLFCGYWCSRPQNWCSNCNRGARSFNQDISSWDTSGVTTMRYMFYEAWAFDQDLGWCVDDGVDLRNAFRFIPCASTSCGVIQGTCPPSPAPTTSAPTPEPDDDDDDSDCLSCTLIVIFSILFACLVFCACSITYIRRRKARQLAKTNPISPAATTPAPPMRQATVVRMGTVEAIHAVNASAADQVQATLVPHATVISVQEP